MLFLEEGWGSTLRTCAFPAFFFGDWLACWRMRYGSCRRASSAVRAGAHWNSLERRASRIVAEESGEERRSFSAICLCLACVLLLLRSGRAARRILSHIPDTCIVCRLRRGRLARIIASMFIPYAQTWHSPDVAGVTQGACWNHLDGKRMFSQATTSGASLASWDSGERRRRKRDRAGMRRAAPSAAAV